MAIEIKEVPVRIQSFPKDAGILEAKKDGGDIIHEADIYHNKKAATKG